MKKRILYIITIITTVGLTSCGSDDVDLTPPSMETNLFNPVPVADLICGTEEPVVFSLTGGDELTFDVIFSDDEALSQYKVDIHHNFDCHGHGGGVVRPGIVPDVDNLTTDWTILEIQDLSGTSVPVVQTFTVPENVTSGNYHFQIQVLDESGNDNPAANFFALKIKNPLDQTPPVIDVLEPKVNAFTVKKGETIRFVGNVSDERSLNDGGNGVLYLSYTDLSSGNSFATNEVFVFDENVETSFDFDFEHTVPLTLVSGSYRYIVGAHDGVRNVAPFQTFEVEVTN